MKKEKKKKIRLKAELKAYSKIKSKIDKVLNDKLYISELDEYVFHKIQEIEEEIYNIGLIDDSENVQEAPKYRPGDEVFYEGVKCTVMAVSHRDNTYDLKSATDRAWVNWNLIK